jgi:glycosyltransferase involved in cell wall biosynthesis
MEKRAALRDAVCLCLPSHQEGFSIALLEALASELPVVISEHCHFPEVAEHGAGLVVPLERDALAAALNQVLADSDLRSHMGSAGRRLVESRYTWEKVAEKCDRVYAEIIASRSHPSAVQSSELCPQTIYGNP